MTLFEKFSVFSKENNPLLIQPAVTVYRSSLQKMEKVKKIVLLNDKFFDSKDKNSSKAISREYIFNAAKSLNKNKCLEDFILSVLYWGFPKNEHGECSKACNSFFKVKEITKELIGNECVTRTEFDEFSMKMARFVGLGISFYSKLMYFTNFSIDGCRCLILDSNVALGIDNLNRKTQTSNQGIKKCLENLNYCAGPNSHRCYCNYPMYIRESHKLAKLLNLKDDDRIEYALFKIGKRELK